VYVCARTHNNDDDNTIYSVRGQLWDELFGHGWSRVCVCRKYVGTRGVGSKVVDEENNGRRRNVRNGRFSGKTIKWKRNVNGRAHVKRVLRGRTTVLLSGTYLLLFVPFGRTIRLW